MGKSTSTTKSVSSHIPRQLRTIPYPRLLGFAFFVVTIVILSALTWMTVLVIRLDHSKSEATRLASLEENLRLALWRIDSTLASTLAQESYKSLRQPPTNPLLLFSFQIAPDGSFTPIAPPHPSIQQQHSIVLAKDISRKRILESIAIESSSALFPFPPQNTVSNPSLAMENNKNIPFERSLSNDSQKNTSQLSNSPSQRSQIEFEQRRGNILSNSLLAQSLDPININQPASTISMMVPIAIENQLLLARRVHRSDGEYIEGFFLDWPGIQAAINPLISDLLVDARLELYESDQDATLSMDQTHRLASIPARLVAFQVSTPLADENANTFLAQLSPTNWLLFLTWLGILSALAATAALATGSILLGERRSAFVTAVTHELRTPLTTFLMYTEMLTQGMVPEPSKQQEYLKTLRHEALRLEHLVENVLAYARLERGRVHQTPQTVFIDDLISRTLPYLQHQTQLSGRMLECATNEAFSESVLANPSLVEQILLNLVDNACKYATPAEDQRILLIVEQNKTEVSIGIRDFGPGLPKRKRSYFSKSLFQPFHKTAQEAAQSAPGVGLGLNLCHRLAAEMGGELRIEEEIEIGAYIKLILPKVV